jgi:tetratricopeptide (TPR) repeat protein
MVDTHLGKLQQQFTNVQQFTQSLDRQQKDLCEWINRLPQILDSSALQSQMKYLTTRLEWSETTLADLQNQVHAVINQGEQPIQSNSEYELVFNLKSAHPHSKAEPLSSSRALLEDALEKAQSRVIIVFPYPDRTLLDADLISKFKAFLDRKGCLDLGWGHLGDLHESDHPRYIHDYPFRELRSQRSSTPSIEKSFLKNILGELTQLKRSYPKQFRFKVLGTDENFLVCDQTYGILGAHPVATTSAAFPEVAVGLRTTRSDVVKGLIDRFDNPTLNANDAVAYYNRAITRYELGDKSGAMADYSEVVRIDPAHAIAYNNRALVRYELGNKEGAIADFNRALLINSRNCVTYCNRGVVRLELGDKVGAIEDYTDAIQIDPHCPIAYLQRGLARLKLGHKTGAVEDFSAMIRLDNQDAIAYFHRGTARSGLGDKTGAIRDFKEAAWLFSAQGNQEKYQKAIAAVNKLRKRLVLSGGISELSAEG